MTTLEVTANRLSQATFYLDVFGACDEVPSKQLQHIKSVFRRLAKIVHPDLYGDADEKKVASAAFTQLQKLLEDAERAVKEGAYGQPLLYASAKTRKGHHSLIHYVGSGDLCRLYATTSKVDGAELATVTKIAKQPKDKDLLQVEADVLRLFRKDGTDSSFHPFVPELVDSFVFSEKSKPRRQANVLVKLEGLQNLEQLLTNFPEGLDPLHMAWIWRRILFALGFVHEQGVVHGALVPNHIMIQPEQHGVVLVDWCYASKLPQDEEEFPPIEAVIGAYRDWYPEEVLAKQAPSSATDIDMAARCMVYAMGGNPLTGNLPERVPRRFRAFFKGCLLQKQSKRPQNAVQLLKEFDWLLEDMGKPYFPRKFQPLAIPTGVA